MQIGLKRDLFSPFERMRLIFISAYRAYQRRFEDQKACRDHEETCRLTVGRYAEVIYLLKTH